jgi:pumilio family protein 6
LVSLFKEQLHQLVHTKDGAHAACLLLSYGTAKDRKSMIKSIREIIPQMSTDQHGHNVLMVVCAVVDDTKLVSKGVLAELKSSWLDLIRDKWGRQLVLFLCREDKDPLIKECREKSVNTSKKDNMVRRDELSDYVSEDFLDAVASEMDTLMRDPLTIQVVQEILLNAKGLHPGVED